MAQLPELFIINACILTITPNNPMPGLHTATVQVQWDNGAHTTSLKTYLTEE